MWWEIEHDGRKVGGVCLQATPGARCEPTHGHVKLELKHMQTLSCCSPYHSPITGKTQAQVGARYGRLKPDMIHENLELLLARSHSKTKVQAGARYGQLRPGISHKKLSWCPQITLP